jgi:hypothetical protein
VQTTMRRNQQRQLTSRFFASLFTRITTWFADTANGIGDFFAQVGNFGRVNTDELCVDDICVTRDEFLQMKEGQSAAAGAPMLRDTVEAPAGSPSSMENDSGDGLEPTSTELQSEDDTLPQSDNVVDNSTFGEETASESVTAPELQASNDNSPVEQLPATGTEY